MSVFLGVELIAVGAASLGPRDFQGRWNIAVLGQAQEGACGWKSVRPDRDRTLRRSPREPDEPIKRRDGKLRFSLKKKWNPWSDPEVDGVFSARLVNGRLEGTSTVGRRYIGLASGHP